MKIEITYVPKEKEILEVVRELKAQAPKAWFFLHDNLIKNLYAIGGWYVNSYFLATKKSWRLIYRIEKIHNSKMIDFIDLSGCEEPESIFFINMEK